MLFLLVRRQGNLPIVVVGIFMPACVILHGRFRTPMKSVNAPTADVLVKSNGTGETASFISINLPFRISH